MIKKLDWWNWAGDNFVCLTGGGPQRCVPETFEHKIVENASDAQGQEVAENVEGEEVEASLK
jgi:hypothetical protein